jgi:putative ABC transport system substrate-binding protein
MFHSSAFEDSAMKRREFIGLIGGATLSPLVARAQQPAKPRTIGFFSPNSASAASPWTAAFVQRLHELGWIESRNFAIEYRWGEGRTERITEFMAEFVRLNVDVIVTHSTPNVLAAKQATSTIPIVFALAADPVGSGIVASLARPGGNVTGLSILAPDLARKRLELLREVAPGLRRLAILADTGLPGTMLEAREVQAAARMLDIDVTILDVQRAEEIAPAFETLKGRAEALYVSAAPIVTTNQVQINTLALAARLPTMHGVREYVEGGGLISYGPNFSDLFRRAAEYVDKILRGAKPADIPVEQPAKFDLVVNLTTGKALGLAIPPSLLARADEVIE